MKVALVIPGTGLVPAVFAHDLARLVGHVASTRLNTEVRILAAADEEPSEELLNELVGVAREWGADVTVFPDVNKRLPNYAFDEMLDRVAAELGQPHKRKIEVVSH